MNKHKFLAIGSDGMRHCNRDRISFDNRRIIFDKLYKDDIFTLILDVTGNKLCCCSNDGNYF